MSRIRLVLLTAATALLALVFSATASATITPLPQTEKSADEMGLAILEQPSQLLSAEFPEFAFSEFIPTATPVGIGDSLSPLTGFPTNGTSFAILSSGEVELIGTDTLQNYPESESFAFGNEFAVSPIPRGEAHDWTVLRLNVDVPNGDNCLALDYRFLSEEFPNFVGSPFNDAFFAEVNANNWSVNGDGSLNRAADFAASPTGEAISVNGVGPTAMSPAEAEGTYFNAATGLITTKTPIAAGPNAIYLSIFDASDEILDSAVFLDNLRFINESAATCQPPVGAQLAIPVTQPGPSVTPPPPPPSNSFSVGSQVKFKGGSEATLSVTVPGPGTVSATSSSTASASVASSLTAMKAARAAATKGKAKGKKKPVLLPATATATGAGTVTLTLKLSATGKKVLAKKHKLTVPVTVTFTPTGGTPASQKVTLTFKPKPKKHHK
jgi:hypothetical protein